jgi:acetyl esterase
MKKVYVILAIVAVVVLAVAALIQSWTVTKYGKLDYRAAILLKYIAAKGDSQNTIPPVAELRKQREDANKLSGKQEPFANIKDFDIPGRGGKVPVRMYTPEGSGPFPMLIYYHGGGWALGNLDSHDNICRKLAKGAGAITISVGYRLAPENPFPAAFDDAYAALQWAQKNAGTFNGNAQKIAVAGDSAGGNLAAVVSQLSRNGGPALVAQVLLYPATDLSRMDTESHNHFAKGFFLERSMMEQFRTWYAPRKEDWSNPKVSPLLAVNFKGLPPALVITDEFDPLRDEGEAYSKRMQEAGISVVHTRYKGMIHGFVGMGRFLPQAGQATDEIAGFLKGQFGEGEKVLPISKK